MRPVRFRIAPPLDPLATVPHRPINCGSYKAMSRCVSAQGEDRATQREQMLLELFAPSRVCQCRNDPDNYSRALPHRSSSMLRSDHLELLHQTHGWPSEFQPAFCLRSSALESATSFPEPVSAGAR